MGRQWGPAGEADNGALRLNFDRRLLRQCLLICVLNGRGIEMVQYSALIRTYNSYHTLTSTLEKLAGQTIPPGEFILVDSGSTDGTMNSVPKDSIIVKYEGAEFNFAAAINQGLEYASSDYALIISSHTLLHNPRAIEYAIGLLDANEYLGACYFSGENDGELRHVIIDKTNFNGFNGLWNTCSLIRYDLWRSRKFRTDVFSAEDQEWAKWLFDSQGRGVARINGAGMDNITLNERMSKHGQRKRRNEYISIAYFSNPNLMTLGNLVRIGYQIFKPSTRPLGERYYNFTLFVSLALCFLRKPKYKSRYF